MENKKKTAVHFFVVEKSDLHFQNIKIEAWKENKNVVYESEPGTFRSVFTLLEQIKIFSYNVSTPSYYTFSIRSGTSMASGHSAESLEEFLKEKVEDTYSYPAPLQVSTREEYLALRKKIFDLYAKNPLIEFKNL